MNEAFWKAMYWYRDLLPWWVRGIILLYGIVMTSYWLYRLIFKRENNS